MNRLQDDQAMTMNLESGMHRELTVPVGERITVPAVFPDAPVFQRMPPVLATAFMVGLIERACIELLSDRLAPGQRSVGTHISVSHIAPTAIGQPVTAAVTLESVRGRRLSFQVAVRDDIELIGEGRHERFVIDLDRFTEGVERKAARSARCCDDSRPNPNPADTRRT